MLLAEARRGNKYIERARLSPSDSKKREFILENIYDYYYSHHGKESGCLVKHSVKNTKVDAESYKRATCRGLLSAII
jgi:hypothetical protein